MAQATFAAGCFWHVEHAFRQVAGVLEVESGYTGGDTDHPSYRDVCTGRTGHAEAVRVEYDPARVSYDDLLTVFWQCHDPTQRNRQGPDVGTQYRSAIFWHDEDQRARAQASLQELESAGYYRRPIVTEIVPASTFWRAEESHQRYFEKHGIACG